MMRSCATPLATAGRTGSNSHVLTNFEPVWSSCSSARAAAPADQPRADQLGAILKMPTRPNPLSTMAPYTSWESLTDRRYDGRHLPPVRGRTGFRRRGRVADLFTRRGERRAVPEVDGACSPTSRSGSPTASCAATVTPAARSAAQRLHATRSTCCRSTGVHAGRTEQLRAHEGGRLKSQTIGGDEFPPYLYDGGVRKPEFAELPRRAAASRSRRTAATRCSPPAATRRTRRSASCCSTSLFLREHNRIAGGAGARVPGAGTTSGCSRPRATS